MKRKRYESTTISNKILCLQNGSNVEVQLDDGKWFVLIEFQTFLFDMNIHRIVLLFLRHSGIIIQCHSRKYLVQVEQQQYWIEFNLVRPNTIIDHVC